MKTVPFVAMAKQSVVGRVDDYAPSQGAALADNTLI